MLLLLALLAVVQTTAVLCAEELALSKLVQLRSLLSDGAQKTFAKQKVMLSANPLEKLVKRPIGKILPSELDKIDLKVAYMGDIRLTSTQADMLITNLKSRRSRRQLANFAPRWDSPDKVPIAYRFDSSLPLITRNAVEQAIKWWTDQTCLKFSFGVPPGVVSYIIFSGTSGGFGCSSQLGRVPGWPNVVYLPSGCEYPGRIAHEIAHSLGVAHEQQRPDTLNKLLVRSHLIRPEAKSQFFILPPNTISDMGTPYDYGSIMHYPSIIPSMAIGGQEKSIILQASDIDYQFTMGQRTTLSFLDVYRMNQLYCSRVCPGPNSCANGGYPDPKNCQLCKCPGGLGGQKCLTMAPSAAGCGGELVAGPNWQPLEVSSGPNCNWMIKSSDGSPVQLKFTSPLKIGCDSNCKIVMWRLRRVPTSDPPAPDSAAALSTRKSISRAAPLWWSYTTTVAKLPSRPFTRLRRAAKAAVPHQTHPAAVVQPGRPGQTAPANVAVVGRFRGKEIAKEPPGAKLRRSKIAPVAGPVGLIKVENSFWLMERYSS